MKRLAIFTEVLINCQDFVCFIGSFFNKNAARNSTGLFGLHKSKVKNQYKFHIIVVA